ncbi:hypothetical protein CROQUDRAFT_654960 [Cronartium quercuum f. sp. fusiforme G11]|uniref:Uncharacterized protein n=1 Tax=Cronartium quercuum f. sp. fusiforme G11 TaxID=708437 RepID=A0A9P6NQK7_9BASI|nr:hypothetical protein CROQUDRAFT_654960 [Cronartium quercuum f. sp. fusiforme G11]
MPRHPDLPHLYTLLQPSHPLKPNGLLDREHFKQDRLPSCSASCLVTERIDSMAPLILGYSSGLERKSVDEPEESAGQSTDDQPLGLLKIQAAREGLTRWELGWMYCFFCLLAWSLSLDQYTSSTYLAEATATTFNAHSVLAAINTVKAVSQAISQPPIAKLSDLLGRVETYVLCVFLYAVGYVFVAVAPNIYVYAFGMAINILGITGLYLLQEIVIGDVSSLRNRLFWSIFPSVPGGINVWLGGNLAQRMLDHSTWRWGIAMFAIMTPVLSVPIIGSLGYAQYRTRHKIKEARSIKLSGTWLDKIRHWITLIDGVGILLLLAGSGCILVNVTIANAYGSTWGSAHTIVLFIIGGLSSIGFVVWEMRWATHPLLPLYLMKNKTVILGLLLGLCHPAAGSIASDYFYTFLVVAANQSVLSATRLTGLATFISIFSCLFAGAVVSKVRKIKWIIIVGAACDTLGLGLMIRYRGSENSLFELVLPQLLRGLAEGLVGFPVQALIQSMTAHEHLASMTAIYLTIFYLSGAVGAAIGGSIWVNMVPEKLHAYIADQGVASAAYSDPFSFARAYGHDTPERQAVGKAYTETQHVILAVATVIAGFSIILAFFLDDPKMPDVQSRPEAELMKMETKKKRFKCDEEDLEDVSFYCGPPPPLDG